MKNVNSIHSIPENHSFNSYIESDRSSVKKGNRGRDKGSKVRVRGSRARDNRWNKYEENSNEYEIDRLHEIQDLDLYRHIKQLNERTESQY